MMNMMIYDVEFPDKQVCKYAANIIAENMLTQVDSDRCAKTLMESIVDYKTDEAVALAKNDMYIVTPRGQKKACKKTQGWRLFVHWADGTKSWILLKDMKELHPIEVAEVAKARGIYNKPAFAWWIPY
eukprot:3485390-Ditylum_brightwellii.AAC.1